MAATPSLLRLYRTFSRLPGGKWVFAKAVCRRAPYFATIYPRVEVLEPGRSVWSMRKRRSVQNHLGTVHALAMGNLCEVAMGLLMEVSLPPHLRWIPTGMTIQYLKKAETDLVGEATVDLAALQPGDVPVPCEVKDAHGNVVVTATIHVYVSEKPGRAQAQRQAA